MRYVQINAFSDSWAHQIVLGKHKELLAQGHDSYVFWGFAHDQLGYNEHRILSPKELEFNNKVRIRFDGKRGFHSKRATKRLLKMLDCIEPDVVHLHSLYNDYVNVEMLFDWLKDHDCLVRWTLHDCWAFTGFCLHFSELKCSRWKAGCKNDCPAPSGKRALSLRAKSNIEWGYEKKKSLFTKLPIDRLTIQVPSQWMADLVKTSYLRDYPVVVVRNEIDRTLFRPVESSFREKHSLNGKEVILGVANPFTAKKGFDDFIRLGRDLDDRFALVLIGVDDAQKEELLATANTSVVCLPVTKSVEDLVDAYNAADCFFNPTREDNYPTVNLEAEACGTPVITYDVGGCRETLKMKESFAVNGYEKALDLIRKGAWKRDGCFSEGERCDRSRA